MIYLSGNTSKTVKGRGQSLGEHHRSEYVLERLVSADNIGQPTFWSGFRIDTSNVTHLSSCFLLSDLLSQVIQGLLAVFYNLGDGDYNITLPFHRLNDGEWHEVTLDRYGREFTLQLDGGGGRREVTVSPGRSQEIIIDPSAVMIGNSFPSGHNRSFLGGWSYESDGMNVNKINEWMVELLDKWKSEIIIIEWIKMWFGNGLIGKDSSRNSAVEHLLNLMGR